jgi:Protein of unknown function (DUF2948)
MSNARTQDGETRAGVAPLRLRALDADDLQTIAGFLQDALVPLSEVAFLKAEQRFVMVANRFRWERPAVTEASEPGVDSGADARFAGSVDEEGGGPLYERINCGICFDRVSAVRYQGLDVRRKSQILNLLTVQSRPGAITLIFAGGAAIRLDVAAIRCHLEDLGEPWPTRWVPSHQTADADPPDRR